MPVPAVKTIKSHAVSATELNILKLVKRVLTKTMDRCILGYSDTVVSSCIFFNALVKFDAF